MRYVDQIEKYAAWSLMFLLVIIVVSATLEVGYIVFTNLFSPPGFFLGVSDLLKVFGLFLMVLIGLELITAVRMFAENHSIHSELMLLVALTAITRKIVILDASTVDPMVLFGIGVIILALTAGYYLIRRSRSPSNE